MKIARSVFAASILVATVASLSQAQYSPGGFGVGQDPGSFGPGNLSGTGAGSSYGSGAYSPSGPTNDPFQTGNTDPLRQYSPYNNPTPQQPMGGYAYQQYCTGCQKTVSNMAKDGDKCPHCGVVWGAKSSSGSIPTFRFRGLIKLAILAVTLLLAAGGALIRKLTTQTKSDEWLSPQPVKWAGMQGYQAPGYQTPGYQTPNYAPPNYTAQNYAAPMQQSPNYTAPNYTAPSYQSPNYPSLNFPYAPQANAQFPPPEQSYPAPVTPPPKIQR